jgi:hypothetical protein
LLPRLIAYFVRHPSLSYLFASASVGSSSQSPRVDESAPELLEELSLALHTLARRESSTSGLISADWPSQVVGETIHDIDRISVADFDKNGVADVAVTEERYPGKEPDAHFHVFSGTKTNQKYSWEKQVLVEQYSMNNLDKGDINNDGNMDLITAEHKGPELKVQLFINDGRGNFAPKTIDTGKENHLGAQLVDLDGDGDLDVVGIAWDNYKYLHIWRNNGIKKKRK